MNKRGGRPRVEGKKKVGLSLDDSLLERLKAEARKEGRSISGAVEKAIKEWLKENVVMFKDNLFPRIKRNAVIIAEFEKQPYDGYVVLQDGTSIRLRGDGTGTAGDGTDYTCVSRGVGEPDGEGGFEEYEVIGWTKTLNVL